VILCVEIDGSLLNTVLKPYFLSQWHFFFNKEFHITTNVVIMTCMLWQFLKDSFIHWYSMQFIYTTSSTNIRTSIAWIQWICQMVLVVLTTICAPELKAHVSYRILIACCPSSVCLQTFTFLTSSPEPLVWTNFNQIWHKPSLGGRDSSLFKWRTASFSKGRW
jgi:hypothetical protein